MDKVYYAHSTNDPTKADWEPLFTPFGKLDSDDPQAACGGQNGGECEHCENMHPMHGHLNKVAYWTGKFASKVNLAEHGFASGLMHDLGKCSKQFQDYISGLETKGGDHSSEGASCFNSSIHEISNQSLNFIRLSIACHHTGLIDCVTPNYKNGIAIRFNNLPDYEHPKTNKQTHTPLPTLKNFNFSKIKAESTESLDLLKKHKNHPHFNNGMLLKFLFSGLIDADRTCTSSFYKRRLDTPKRNWKLLIERFNNTSERKFKDENSELNLTRKKISGVCLSKATAPQGTYRLSLPTGSGKTLTSLRYALKHAEHHKLDQIIYVVPYTTILEQNAAEAREFLEDSDFVVLEHHSNISNELRKKTATSEEAPNPYDQFSENWDAPVIFTTTVQFFNSIYKDGTKNIRRFHRLANSVIIFDEIQTLPPKLTHLFTRSVNFLNTFTKSTLVLCTATQPTVDKLPKKDESLILAENADLVSPSEYNPTIFNRYLLFNLGKINTSELVKRCCNELISKHVLIVVNTKKDALRITELLRQTDAVKEADLYFLTTDLCPEHRKDRIEKLRAASKHDSKKSVICVSTNLIEAGVDLDFAIVFRASAPLDSLLQAAGRCNRHGKRPQKGSVFHFELEEESLHTSMRHIKEGAQLTRAILASHTNEQEIGDSEIHHYFKERFNLIHDEHIISELNYPIPKQKTNGIDTHMTSLLGGNNKLRRKTDTPPSNIFCQSFKTAGQAFEVIDGDTVTLLVPYKRGSEIIHTLRNLNHWEFDYALFREAQTYSVTVYQNQFQILQGNCAVEIINEENGVYALVKDAYDETTHLGTLYEKEILCL